MLLNPWKWKQWDWGDMWLSLDPLNGDHMIPNTLTNVKPDGNAVAAEL